MTRSVAAAKLPERLRRELNAVAEPSRAPAMQAYMKSSMPYFGVGSDGMRAAARRAFAEFQPRTAAEWRRGVLAVWRGAKYREERYGAVELAGERRFAPFQTMDALPMYEEMIVSGAWWDTVDAIATHQLGQLLRRYQGPMRRTMRAWSRSTDVWKRRSAIICQMRFKSGTDLKLLYECIEPALSSREFFLRKAIGWALRQYAWTDPEEVVRYVTARGEALSPLSRREALKNVGRIREGRGRGARRAKK